MKTAFAIELCRNILFLDGYKPYDIYIFCRIENQNAFSRFHKIPLLSV